MSSHSIPHVLKHGDLKLEGEFVQGFNYTFLVQVTHEDETLRAVYKPQEGERPLWDFPENTLAQREAAAYLVSDALGWDLVPATVYREDGPFGPGSVQFFISHNPDYNYFNLRDEDFQRLRPVVAFDFLINNADRKGSHLLFGEEGELWLIDHGLGFNVEEKLRTVIWEFAGQPIPLELHADLEELKRALKPGSELVAALAELLASEEILALAARAESILAMEYFPYPPQDRRAYPFPPL
jgi:uncharacterized repeat protein (TIGR03843 family)